MSEPPPPQQRKYKAPTTLEERRKAPVSEQAEAIRNEGVLPQREPETEQVELNFLHYIRPRRDDAGEAYLPKKVVTTLVVPRIPVGMTLLNDILLELAVLKFQDFDTRQ